MILGLGIDTVTISTVEGFLQNPEYARDIFTEEENELSASARDYIDFLSGRFAAKQAINKALEPLIGCRIEYLDVSVLKNADGSPLVEFHGELRKLVKKTGIREVRVSTTTEGDAATAIAIAQD